jgi:hypothetical protein
MYEIKKQCNYILIDILHHDPDDIFSNYRFIGVGLVAFKTQLKSFYDR